jgi:hypothetical protein
MSSGLTQLAWRDAPFPQRIGQLLLAREFESAEARHRRWREKNGLFVSVCPL